jgi:hypothetical protein
LHKLFIQAANVILVRPQNSTKFSFGQWLAAASERNITAPVTTPIMPDNSWTTPETRLPSSRSRNYAMD